MKKFSKTEPVGRREIFGIFEKVDSKLQKEGSALSIITIGGVSLILQELRDRATLDIDVVNNPDALRFQKLCFSLGVPVDIVTVTSTVDFQHAPKTILFRGEKLIVESVTPKDLLKLKLERFYKQDPEDIYAIIEKINLAYEDFKELVTDALPGYIGNPRTFLLSAWIVVDRMYPSQSSNFKALLDAS